MQFQQDSAKFVEPCFKIKKEDNFQYNIFKTSKKLQQITSSQHSASKKQEVYSWHNLNQETIPLAFKKQKCPISIMKNQSSLRKEFAGYYYSSLKEKPIFTVINSNSGGYWSSSVNVQNPHFLSSKKPSLRSKLWSKIAFLGTLGHLNIQLAYFYSIFTTVSNINLSSSNKNQKQELTLLMI